MFAEVKRTEVTPESDAAFAATPFECPLCLRFCSAILRSSSRNRNDPTLRLASLNQFPPVLVKSFINSFASLQLMRQWLPAKMPGVEVDVLPVQPLPRLRGARRSARSSELTPAALKN